MGAKDRDVVDWSGGSLGVSFQTWTVGVKIIGPPTWTVYLKRWHVWACFWAQFWSFTLLFRWCPKAMPEAKPFTWSSAERFQGPTPLERFHPWRNGIHTYIRTYVRTYIDTLMHWYMDTLIHWCIDALMHWYIDALMHWYIHTLVAPFALPNHFHACPTVLQELLRVWHPDKNPESSEVVRSLRIIWISSGSRVF